MIMKDYKSATVERVGQIATVTMLTPAPGSGANIHWDLGSVFSDLREDNSVRVIVLTGSGGSFRVAPSKKESEGHAARNQDPAWHWKTFTGILRTHQAMAEIEKPIIAKVNGDAVGFGQSVMFSCDFIVAREDALIMDHHMGGTFVSFYDGVRQAGGSGLSNVPGDGGAALVPLLMSPYKAKEYLMLAQPYTARQLADMNIINYAVPAEELDAKVAELAKRLLAKSAYAIARTKRIVNRRIAEQLNLTLDASVAYEMVTMMQPSDLRELG
jgi:enoyl-CoA hydratase/carnithine racemase